MQTFCISACKYYSFLFKCISRATSFDSSLAHFGDNCFKKKTMTCFYLTSIKKHHLHCSLSCGRLTCPDSGCSEASYPCYYLLSLGMCYSRGQLQFLALS